MLSPDEIVTDRRDRRIKQNAFKHFLSWPLNIIFENYKHSVQYLYVEGETSHDENEEEGCKVV